MDRVLSFLGSIRWQDLVDILFNSYVLFRLYVLFQGTTAFRILVGIASLWIIQMMAASLGLILTSWALQGITAAAAIIIVVVFRNEIRSALQVRHLKTFLWGYPHFEQRSPVEVITESAYQMGRNRIGALIVFPGREDIKEVVHGGIAWDGQVSREMITSIFWPKNPVHDGAIIIEGDRIAEVGVLLPLSQRQDLPTIYGTRHRAAAGLAEVTDSLVIAVSEERGRVTVAKDRMVKAIGTPEELGQVLRDHLNISEEAEVQRAKRERLRIAMAGVLSLMIITGIWFGFTKSRDTIIAIEVPIEYVGRPNNLEILDTSVNQVQLQLKGSSALIKSLKPGQVEARVNLAKAEAGLNVIPITAENINVPPGVFLNKVNPPDVEITLDFLVTKEVPIQVDWVGKLPDHLRMVKAELEPSTIRLTGGNRILKNIKTVYTAPVRLDSLSGSGAVSAALALRPASVKVVSGSDRVTIHYLVKEKAAERDQGPN